MLRFLTAGESHGKGITVIIDGMPSNVPISEELINKEMQKRKTGSGSGGRMMLEDDSIQILSGIRNGKTIGSPITILIMNNDNKHWDEKVTQPRPGHADLAGTLKYGFDDIRNVLERASARETVGRVAAGAIFKQLISVFDIEIASHTIQIGKVKITKKEYGFDEIKKVYETDPEIRCIESEISRQMKNEIEKARKEMDTLGGVIEVWANNVPAGLGSHVQYDRKIDGQIAQSLMSIQSVKAVEIGTAIENAGILGSLVQDEIYYEIGKGFYRNSNQAGGIEGGITNGMPVIVRTYLKPISTIYKPLNTVDIETKLPVKATVQRSDICVVPRAGAVVESMLSYVIAKNILEKFGGDNIDDIKKSFDNYLMKLL